MHFSYCPYCGKKLTNKKIGDEGIIPYCNNCNIPLWDMFTTSIISAVINENNEIALLKQNYVSKTNYVLVAGIMKTNESAESTAIREIKEELGLDIKKDELKYIATYKRLIDYAEVYLLEKDINLNEITMQEDEVQDVRYASLKEFEEMINKGEGVESSLPFLKNYFKENLKEIKL